MKELETTLRGYKTKILAISMAVINLLQVFGITKMTDEQISAIMGVLVAGLALTIYDKLNRYGK